jgi:hypothetical protein
VSPIGFVGVCPGTFRRIAGARGHRLLLRRSLVVTGLATALGMLPRDSGAALERRGRSLEDR